MPPQQGVHCLSIQRHSVHSQLALSLVATLAILPGASHAATAMVTITATVLSDISVQATSELAFGALDTSTRAGTIVLGRNGTRYATGGARVDHGQPASPANLVIRGEPRAGFSISMPVSARIVDAAGASMVVDHFRQSTGKVVSLDGQGRRVVRVGATLHVNPNQPLGTYAGTMLVTVNYN
jgi:spore coat protein U-like protein